MSLPTESEVAIRLKELFDSEFEGRNSGAFRLQRDKFREMVKRTRLERAVVDRIAAALLKQFKLVLIEGSDFLVVMRESQFDKIRVVPYKLVRR